MFSKSDALELKRRISKDKATFTRVSGCYVNSEKNIITKLNETFLNLPDDEYYKYLDIAKKVLSGNLMDNLLEVPFSTKEELKDNNAQKKLLALRDSKLKNEELLDKFYDTVIENYDCIGNYLILVFHDAYDVIKKDVNGTSLDDSEEVFEYLLCAICPVDLSKSGLGYIEDENDIGARIRDWVVGVPQTGFVYPTFAERTTDIHSLMFYTKNTKEPHSELYKDGFNCEEVRTSTEKRNSFIEAINTFVGDDNTVLEDIQCYISDMIYSEEEDKQLNIPLTKEVLHDILYDNGLLDEQIEKIIKDYNKMIENKECYLYELIDKKIVENGKRRHEKLNLIEQIESLTEQLHGKDGDNKKVYINAKDDNVQILEIDGQKYVRLAITNEEEVIVNGKKI